MSVENAKYFYKRVTTDAEFRIRLEQIASVAERRQIILAAGYKFTPEEWQIAKEQILAAADSNDGELTDAELTAINGGLLPFSLFELAD